MGFCGSRIGTRRSCRHSGAAGRGGFTGPQVPKEAFFGHSESKGDQKDDCHVEHHRRQKPLIDQIVTAFSQRPTPNISCNVTVLAMTDPSSVKMTSLE
jgi:hypothetical protein